MRPIIIYTWLVNDHFSDDPLGTQALVLVMFEGMALTVLWSLLQGKNLHKFCNSC